jgi:hypothetical protein
MTEGFMMLPMSGPCKASFACTEKMGALEVSPTRLIIRYPETFVLQSVREIYATIRKDACG